MIEDRRKRKTEKERERENQQKENMSNISTFFQLSP